MTKRLGALGWAMTTLLCLAGCQPVENPADAGSPNDSGIPTDAGSVDAGQSDAGAPTDAGTSDAGTPDGGAQTDAGATDAGSPNDAGLADAGALVLPSCLGTAVPMIQSGQVPYVTVKVGASPGTAGAFLVDFGSNISLIDLNGFPAPAPVPTSCMGNPSIPGARCLFADLDYFGSWGQVSLYTANYASFVNPRQCGILGTDFLSLNVTTLDFANDQIRSASAQQACTEVQLLDAGFAPVSTVGFFTNNTSNLVPLLQVIQDGGSDLANYTVPNIPTVKLRIAGVDALAQLDTGFNDNLIKHAININEGYLQALVAAAPTALVRDVGLDHFLTTCVGVSETVEGYRLAAGQTAAFVSESNTLLRAEPSAVIFVKRTPPAAKVCGGIGTWTVTAAQVGGSFLVDAKAVVFDPFAHRVWLPTH